MKKLESTFLNMTLVLTVITLLSSGILAYVYSVTKAPIEAAILAKKEQAIKDVLPKNDAIDTVVVVNDLNVYKAYLDGVFVGAAVESASIAGYCSPIRVMVGFSADGSINTYSVLSQAETPGLGTKMVDWFKTKSSICGLMPTDENLSVTKSGGNIDAITAATISSKAFLGCIISAANAYAEINGNTTNALSGATDAASGATSIETTDSTVINTQTTDSITTTTVDSII